ncbi:MAG: glycosyltransferase family 2 protein [Chitinophagales bacterium]|nr:glycosyltransferase family 2 protein [Chitinophagales bacterium]
MNEVYVIIPALDEEESIVKVIEAIPQFVKEIIVVDNASSDNTSQNARNAGAIVLYEEKKGYGNACLKGIDHLITKLNTSHKDIVVFLDGDFSDYPEDMIQLIDPITHNEYDLVIGARNKAGRAKNSMTPQQIFGNWLATKMMKFIYGYEFTDLGPFRAIKVGKLLQLQMTDKTYGWTVEMQVKALKQKLNVTEIPVRYRERIGVSKVSGTFKGTILAGYKIITTIIKHAV